MRVVVLGASGQSGSLVAAELVARGVEVVAAQRSSGVDAYTGQGLAEVCAGADAVVDCTDIRTQSAKKAVDFFGTVAGNVADAAIAAGVGRVVCLSIINAADPQVHAKFGYYRGKAAQEQAYREKLGGDRLVTVRSAQWFELARQLMSGLQFGPVAVVPRMLSRPLAMSDAARAVADAVTEPEAADIEIAGPQEIDLVDVARTVARRDGAPRWVIPIRFGGPAIRGGGLLPRGGFRRAPMTFADWLEKTG